MKKAYYWFLQKKAFTLLGVYLVAGFLAVEIGVRSLLYLEWKHTLGSQAGLNVPDSILGYRLKPGKTSWGCRINSLGYRGSEFPMTKSSGTFRIACVGNSITFGEAASADSTTYPFLLEKLIRLKGELPEDVQVINAGIMGYSSYQTLMDVKTRIVTLQPDLIILCTGWNDITLSKYIGWTRDINWENPWHFMTPNGSYALWLFNQRVLHKPAVLNSAALQAFGENLDEVILFCRRNNIPLAFLDPPTMFSEDMTPAEEKKCLINYFVRAEIPLCTAYVSKMKETASRHGIPVLDSGLTYQVGGKDSLIVDVCHPNDIGYHYMVRVLYPQVKEQVLRIMRRENVQTGS